MPAAAIFAIDIAAITLLAYGIYFRRHRRRDMLLAYVGLNVGVMAVTTALDTATVGTGFGLGLFGVLSIIRLRSSEISQEEVAYYFVSLAMGLLAGVTLDPSWAAPALMGVMIVVMFVADHPRLLVRYRHQIITLDAAYTDERELRERLETLLCADIKQVTITRVDLVRDTTVVDVRYRLLDLDKPRAHQSAFEPQELLGVPGSEMPA